MSKKSDVSLQTLAEFMRDLVYDDFSRNLRWSLSVIHPKTDDGDVGFSGGIWTDYQKVKNQMSISFGFSDKVYATGNRWAKENFDATHN